MMKRILPMVWGFLLAALVGGVLGYIKGINDTLIREFKVYRGNLNYGTYFEEGRLSLDLKEFLKGRYYYLGNRIPLSSLDGAAYDYGQVSTNIAVLSIGKGPTTGQEEYRLFKQRGVSIKKP